MKLKYVAMIIAIMYLLLCVASNASTDIGYIKYCKESCDRQGLKCYSAVTENDLLFYIPFGYKFNELEKCKCSYEIYIGG